MQTHSYNIPTASISRLDELLNRNQLIYQNLKEKLEGINQSNQNIYRNINHINSNYDPFSQQSSAIEKEAPIKNKIGSRHLDSMSSTENQELFSQSRLGYEQGYELPRIDQYNEVTFSQETKRSSKRIDYEERKLLDILQEKDNLKQLELLLEQKKLIQQQKMIVLERNNILKRQEIQRQQSYSGRQNKQRKYSHQDKTAKLQIQKKFQQNQSKRQAIDNIYQPKPVSKLKQHQILTKPLVKDNSIYLNHIPKTKNTSNSQILDQIPTFRDINDSNGKIEYQREESNQSKNKQSSRAKYIRQANQQLSSRRKNGKQTYQLLEKYNRQNQFQNSKKNSNRNDKNHYLNNWNQTKNEQDKKGSTQTEFSNIKILESQQYSQNQLQNILAKTEGNFYDQTPIKQLNTHFRLKLQQIERVPECYLFAPFNKVYRSPILQIKAGSVIIQRKSKTSPLSVSNRNKIIDGIKYKFKSIITDEQELLKNLFGSEAQINQSQFNRVAIVGGRQVLKKKLHMGLLAYAHQYLIFQIQKSSQHQLISIQHQQINPQDEPFIYESSFQMEPSSKKITFMKLSKDIQDIYELIKKTGSMKNGKTKILRMTKIVLSVNNRITWSINIISSNRYDFDFLRYLKVNKICWSINPLVKYYDDVKDTLDSMKYYVHAKKNK